ncbi:MAG: MarR family transcriptional regulator [Streptosporangiaceae bacterium]|nr:MarR family transcriptional regulator [Streptosporangiaceae bacterium]
MTASPPSPAGSPVSPDVAELDRALTRIAYLLTRNRRNGLTTTAAGVPLDRAAVTVLLALADSGAIRPGELAARLEVEAPHVTRQVQRLEKTGYAERGPDPDDRRAQLVQLTPSGTAAAGRIREVGRRGMQAALAHWPPDELHQFATLFHRMVDDFLAYDAEHQPAQPNPKTSF